MSCVDDCLRAVHWSPFQASVLVCVLSWLQGKVGHTFLLGSPGPACGLQTESPSAALVGFLCGL